MNLIAFSSPADSIDPFIVSFPDDITVSVPFGTQSTPVNWDEPTAFDNSGTVFPSKSAEPGSSFPTGQTTPVTYTFTDPTGNSVTRQFTVTVVELRKCPMEKKRLSSSYWNKI